MFQHLISFYVMFECVHIVSVLLHRVAFYSFINVPSRIAGVSRVILCRGGKGWRLLSCEENATSGEIAAPETKQRTTMFSDYNG